MVNILTFPKNEKERWRIIFNRELSFMIIQKIKNESKKMFGVNHTVYRKT